MNQHRFLLCSFLAVIVSIGTCFNSRLKAEDAKELLMESKVTEVTLYRTQALVTRTIEIDGDPGAQEIVISDLPENIDPSSLFAEGGEGVEVRAVRYRARAVSESPREDVRQLEEEINSINERVAIIKKQTALLAKQSKYLDKLESFTPPTANFDLGRGVLNAETIEQLTNFSFTQRKELLDSEVAFSKEQAELQKQLNLANRKIREITNGSTNQERQAVLFTQKVAAGKQTIRVNYLTNSCGWSPTYTVRAETGADAVRLEYNGLIRQMSGEDWSNVKLTLSTASPALSAAGPGLAPFKLTLTPNAQLPSFQPPNSNLANAADPFSRPGGGMAPQQQAQSAVVMMGKPSALKELMKQQKMAIRGNRVAISNTDNLKTSWAINSAVNNFDCVAITSETPVGKFVDGVGQSDEPALNYEIAAPVSLQSRNSQQMVRVLATDLESEFYHVATPVLTSYVYRETEVSNDSQSDFLEGPLTVYLDGRFVGRSEIPTVARGQSFVVGLGADSQLRARRELADKSKKVNGGNRETKLEYKLTIENYKDAAAKIRLVDRMPVAEDDSNIRVTLADDAKEQLSKDGVYVRTLLPKGILRWDTEVAGRAIGEDSHEVEYSFTLEHDRQYIVSLPSNLQQQEIEYNELENSRRGGKRMRK